MANTYVRTRGVVTAAYPAGGFFGFVIQTEGTGGGDRRHPGCLRRALGPPDQRRRSRRRSATSSRSPAPVQENFGLTRLSYTPTDVEQALEVLADDARGR